MFKCVGIILYSCTEHQTGPSLAKPKYAFLHCDEYHQKREQHFM